ncbi:hypothetical protein [Sphingomonas aerophila]|uniref:Uncharacterized protein n=1 Tax=Sphingomonas aerophila TaxID=1344948 RepID=A0A7W9EVX8_9SPHN|nr:hypothetical protein [Sphingomonas aerophila]MBB5716809.1 hypothetical protein [Sphingomonas aerophila]
MIEHEPVDILGLSENLAAMTTGVIAHAVDETNGLWLYRKGGSPLLLSAWGVDIADRFEVFTLTVMTLEQAQAAAGGVAATAGGVR